MAAPGSAAFSCDGELFACCQNDGRLRIWETGSGRLKQEFTSNLHLTSPSCVLTWLAVSSRPTNSSPSPWKKRKKKQDDQDHRSLIALGSTSGSLTIFDAAKGAVHSSLEGHNAPVTALAFNENAGLISAAEDYHIIQWSIESGVKSKWKSGKNKTTALAVHSDGKTVVSGERLIKWWNLETKELIKSFAGHANQVTCLSIVELNSEAYVISGASGDSCLSVWALNDEKTEKTSVASLALQDEPLNLSSRVSEESQVTVLSTTRSGQVQLFKYQPNGRTKPLKPTLSVAVASDLNREIQQIPILSSQLTLDEKLLLVWGSILNPTFEKVSPDFSDKVQCLVRSEIRRPKDKKEEISKVKPTIIEEDVEYLAPGIADATPKRNRNSSGSGSQILLKDRLENLSLGTEASSVRTTTKGGNLAQLLMQGLNSKDRTILSNVLFTKNETIVRNTVAKLPVQAISPLLKELTVLLQGKTYASKIAVKWLEALLTTHAAHFLSRPDLAEAFSPILSFIDAKLALFTEVTRLKGRVSLVTGQISQTKEDQDIDIREESVLVYQDPDSSEEDEGLEEEELESESDNWEELSDQENEQENRSVKSGDENDSICS